MKISNLFLGALLLVLPVSSAAAYAQDLCKRLTEAETLKLIEHY